LYDLSDIDGDCEPIALWNAPKKKKAKDKTTDDDDNGVEGKRSGGLNILKFVGLFMAIVV
jgi:hypothetical protein